MDQASQSEEACAEGRQQVGRQVAGELKAHEFCPSPLCTHMLDSCEELDQVEGAICVRELPLKSLW